MTMYILITYCYCIFVKNNAYEMDNQYAYFIVLFFFYYNNNIIAYCDIIAFVLLQITESFIQNKSINFYFIINIIAILIINIFISIPKNIYVIVI
jgi:hypothetical protein